MGEMDIMSYSSIVEEALGCIESHCVTFEMFSTEIVPCLVGLLIPNILPFPNSQLAVLSALCEHPLRDKKN